MTMTLGGDKLLCIRKICERFTRFKDPNKSETETAAGQKIIFKR
jgi:hypothetical protein